MNLVSAVHRPNSISLAVEFTEEALMLNSDTEIALLLTTSEPMSSYIRPLTENSLFFDPMMAEYAGLNSMPNIKASQHFNANYDYPNCFIISLHQEVASGILRIYRRQRNDRYAQVEEEMIQF